MGAERHQDGQPGKQLGWAGFAKLVNLALYCIKPDPHKIGMMVKTKLLTRGFRESLGVTHNVYQRATIARLCYALRSFDHGLVGVFDSTDEARIP